MSASPREVARSVTLIPSRDGRLLPYGIVTFVSLAAAIFTGEGALASLAAPFAVALAIGLRRAHAVDVTARVVLLNDRVLEGDTIEGRLEIEWSGAFDAHIVLDRLKGVSPTPDFHPHHWEAATERIELPIRLEATQWGRHTVGEVWLRLTVPLGLLSWTGKVLVGPTIRVLPGTEKLTQLLSPSRSRTAWGVHRSRRVGDGHEFAELRPYAPGDRIRDLNWAATARHKRPIVNRHHPEVSGDVVIAIEAYDDGSAASVAILTKAARMAWALASVHMRVNDRVGLIGMGRSTQWLPPSVGRLAQYRLMESLLRIGGEAADGVMTPRRWIDVPPAALVIAISPLHSDDGLLTMLSWRARNRSLAVIMIDATSAIGHAASASEQLAARLWSLELERRAGQLRRLGVPVVRAPTDGAMTPVVSALRQARRTASARHS